MNEVQQRIDDLVKGNRVVLFMKGTAQFPMCGFSGRAIQILKQAGYHTLFVTSTRSGWRDLDRVLHPPRVGVHGPASSVETSLARSVPCSPGVERILRRTASRIPVQAPSPEAGSGRPGSRSSRR